MQNMTAQSTPDPDPRSEAQWLRKLDRATAAHEKTRATLEVLITDARDAGVSLTAIAEHTPYSREWVRKIAMRVEAGRSAPSAS
jgi:hypothetical protein